MRLKQKALAILALGCAMLCALSQPTLAQEREWSLDAQDEDAYLVFGVPESDDVGVSFWCKLGSGHVKLFFPEGAPALKPDAQEKFEIAANGKTFSLSGRTANNELLGTVSIETETGVQDEVITALLSADRFSTEIAGHETIYPLVDSGLDELVNVCKVK
ncbi:MAG: hypothetical protein U1E15_07495 [Hyphomicrobiales bacterium]